MIGSPFIRFLGVLALCIGSLRAQAPPCTYDCPENIWTEVRYIPISLGNGCAVNVGYVERVSCDGKVDFQLTGSYTWLTSACAQVQGILDQDGAWAEQVLRTIHGRAMRALITNHFLMLPAPPSCDQGVDLSYRVSYGACSIKHHLSQETGITSYVVEKCGENCCLHLYTACSDGGLVRIVNVTPAGSNDILCPFSARDPFTRCHQVCFDE